MPIDNPTGGEALAALPDGLRAELLQCFREIVVNYREHRWEPSELNGGKFSEVVYTILRGYIDGSYPDRAYKPGNFLDAASALAQVDAQRFTRSIRIQIPRVLIALYEVRNNRGVGHIGGDVNPNHMDATAVLSMAKWVMAELVRVFHDTSVETATHVIDLLIEREIPLIWEVGGRKRVLDPSLSLKDQTLLLLYSATGPVNEKELHDWLERRAASTYRKDVLRPLHNQRFIEYDRARQEVHISPLGESHVETNLSLLHGAHTSA